MPSLRDIIVAVLHFFTAGYFRPEPLDPDLASQKMKHIVIVGGSFAGVCTAHRFLKNASKSPTIPYKVTLVSRDSHFFWNIAAPRALIPGQIPDEKLFLPLAAGFSQYGPDKFEFVLGTATGLDVGAKQLVVADAGGNETVIGYDYLVLGTGSRTRLDGPFKSSGSTESVMEALHSVQNRMKDARSVAVVGAGPTGVETAGEIAFEYGRSKDVTLISGGPVVLETRPPSVSRTALNLLEDLGVKVRLDTKVREAVQLPDGKQELELSSGEKLVFDICISTFGIVPNSSLVPPQCLDANGFIKVDQHLRAEGVDDVFAIGDVNNTEPAQFMFVNSQSIHTAKNLVLVLRGKPLVPYKASKTSMIGVQIGKKAATGHFGSLRLPGFFIANMRKNLFMPQFPATVDGSGL